MLDFRLLLPPPAGGGLLQASKRPRGGVGVRVVGFSLAAQPWPPGVTSWIWNVWGQTHRERGWRKKSRAPWPGTASPGYLTHDSYLWIQSGTVPVCPELWDFPGCRVFSAKTGAAPRQTRRSWSPYPGTPDAPASSKAIIFWRRFSMEQPGWENW